MVSLSLYAFGANIPHPDKAKRGGEDSFFVGLPSLSAIGVADGVGGWANQGINPKHFADDLMAYTFEEMEAGMKNPVFALDNAYNRVEQTGSCTAVVGIMDENGVFQAANLGDSGFMIIRKGDILFRTEEQQHGFNFPYQLGKMEGRDGHYYSHGQDLPIDADVYEIQLRDDDIIIMGSDGLFDNIWDDDILKCVMDNEEDGPKIVASILAEYAHIEAGSEDIWSPFAERALQDGRIGGKWPNNRAAWMGGKMDDITVIVAYVLPMTRRLMGESHS